MIKLKNILVNEVGEGTAKPLKWKVYSDPARNITITVRDLMGRHKQREVDSVKIEYTAQSATNPKFYYIIKFDTQLTNAGFDHAYRSNRTSSNAGAILVQTNISFTLTSDASRDEPETNLNEQYRVIATVIECVKDYIDRVEGLVISINGDEYTCIIQTIFIAPKSDTTGNVSASDSRRGRLYQAFIKKNLAKLPIDMRIDTQATMFILRRKSIFDSLKF